MFLRCWLTPQRTSIAVRTRPGSDVGSDVAYSISHIVRGVGLASIGTGLGALLGMATIKVLAITLGPSGTGFYSLIKQLAQACITAATLNSQSAIVQAIASRHEAHGRARYLGTVARPLMVAIALIVMAMMLGADQLARQIMPAVPEQFSLAIRYSAMVVVAGAAATFLAGIVNGHRAVGVLVLGQVFSGLAALVCVAPVAALTGHHGESAVVLLLAASQTAALLVYLIWAARRGVIGMLNPFAHATDHATMRHFISISGTTLLTGLATAGTMLAVRALVARTHGLDGAGLFDAAYTISAGYIGLFLGGFGTYYMPALAAIKNPADRVIFIRRMFLLTVLVSTPLLAVLALLRSPMISALYSSDYAAAAELLRYFVVGDFLKASAWVFAYLAIAFPNMRMLLACDLSWNIGFLLLGAGALTAGYPLSALGIAYALLYSIYLAAVGIYAHRVHGVTLSKSAMLLWLTGFSIVVLSAWCDWA